MDCLMDSCLGEVAAKRAMIKLYCNGSKHSTNILTGLFFNVRSRQLGLVCTPDYSFCVINAIVKPEGLLNNKPVPVCCLIFCLIKKEQ